MISLIFVASVVVVSSVSKELIIDVDLSLSNMGGTGYQRYDSESFSNVFSEYLLKFTSVESAIGVNIYDSEGTQHTFIILPRSKRIKFIGDIDYIGLSPFVISSSFHFMLQGIKFNATYAYFPIGVVYCGLFIIFFIQLRKDVSSEDEDFVRTKEY